MKGRPGPRLGARLVKNELKAFLSYINENVIPEILERTNDQMRKKVNVVEFLFHYKDTNKEEIIY